LNTGLKFRLTPKRERSVGAGKLVSSFSTISVVSSFSRTSVSVTETEFVVGAVVVWVNGLRFLLAKRDRWANDSGISETEPGVVEAALGSRKRFIAKRGRSVTTGASVVSLTTVSSFKTSSFFFHINIIFLFDFC
jgi:hypothetical protein